MRNIGPNIEVVEPLNEGGTAKIYLGVNTWSGKLVAIKELKIDFSQNDYIRQKFIEEANQYLYLAHPNIVNLIDFIDQNNSQFLVMEYVDGQNLFEYQKNVTGPMPVSMSALLVSEVCNALQYAHNNHVVHLDIKPSNIMLSKQNQIKVLDFGISRDIKTKNSEKLMGSPSYMSPEQINRSNLDHRTDIYSLGITLFELITGRLPFNTAKSRDELFDAIRYQPIPLIGNNNSLNTIIARSTAKNKFDRYQSCDEFREDLLPLFE
jgi:eukaryotic-like serine/threonine-protein kinase